MKTNLIQFTKNSPGRLSWLTILLMMASLLAFDTSYAQSWDEQQKIVASQRLGGGLFGNAVSFYGDYAMVGARQESRDASGANGIPTAGAAYIFTMDGSGSWYEAQKLVASDRDSADQFGYSVCVSENYAIVGARLEDHDASGNNYLSKAGSAYIFERDVNGNWQQAQKIVASDRDSLDYFGWSVSISGNYAIVGAYIEDEDANGSNTLSSAGAAYIFERNGNGNWIEVQKIVASDRASDDQFGVSVSISGSYAIVGAFLEDEDARGRKTLNNSGSAYVFERDGSGNWLEVDKLVASDREATDLFAYSVSISGSTALIGARSDGHSTYGNAGSAYIFDRNGRGDWKQTQKIVASDAAPSDWFGFAVALSGSHAIVGARAEDDDADGNNFLQDAGSAYIYEKNASGTWVQTEKVVASDRANGDVFGWSVGISGDYAIVGAMYEDEDASGGNTRNIAGSAYIFERQDACTQSTLSADAGSDQSTYFGYAPEECATLSGSASGGSTPYTYSWDNGSSSATTSVCPSATRDYQLTVTDAAGCTATDLVTVNVTDVRCRGKKIWVCHNGTSTCVSESQVASHLAHGDQLGECTSTYSQESDRTGTAVNVYPNPTHHLIHIDFDRVERVESMVIMDLSGKEILKVNGSESRSLILDVHSLSSGMYVLRLNYAEGMNSNIRVVKH